MTIKKKKLIEISREVFDFYAVEECSKLTAPRACIFGSLVFLRYSPSISRNHGTQLIWINFLILIAKFIQLFMLGHLRQTMFSVLLAYLEFGLYNMCKFIV